MTVQSNLFWHTSARTKALYIIAYINQWFPLKFGRLLNPYLAGGFKYFCYFHPEIWGRFPFWRIFFRWVGSTTNQLLFGTGWYLTVVGLGLGWLNRTSRRFQRSWSHAWVASYRSSGLRSLYHVPRLREIQGIRGEDEMGFMKMPWA